jgi:hypothetical protein
MMLNNAGADIGGQAHELLIAHGTGVELNRVPNEPHPRARRGEATREAR